jgi:hypothetical protein
MNPALAVVAVVVVAGAVVAAGAREVRLALIGLAVALVAAPMLAEPIPSSVALAARIVAALLAVEFLWIATRIRRDPEIDSPLGWPAELLGAVAVTFVGGAVALDTLRPAGPPEAAAAGAAMLFLAIRPIVLGRDALRIGIGLLLLVTGVLLGRAGLVGAPGDVERLVEAGVILAIGAAIAWRVRAARTAWAG